MTMRIGAGNVFGRAALTSVVISGMLLVGTTTAHAADATIPRDTTMVAGTVGEQVELAEVAGGFLVGSTCEVTALHDEAGVRHPGNNLVVTSGASSVTLEDVEREPGAATGSDVPLTIGDVIRVEVVLGADAAFGGDVSLEIDCAQSGPGGSLPATGFEHTIAAVGGGMLVALGASLTWAARERRPRRSPAGS
jgi:hypothetical protein